MLEDQQEERACLHVLGLLDEKESRAFRAEAADNDALRRTVAELEETLANLSLSTTPIHQPGDALRRALFERIDAEPARVTTDRLGFIETINPAFTRLCGYRIEELRGRKPGHVLQGPESDPAVVKALRDAVRGGYGCEVTLVNYHKSRAPYRVRITLDPVHNANNQVTGYAATERELVA